MRVIRFGALCSAHRQLCYLLLSRLSKAHDTTCAHSYAIRTIMSDRGLLQHQRDSKQMRLVNSSTAQRGVLPLYSYIVLYEYCYLFTHEYESERIDQHQNDLPLQQQAESRELVEAAKRANCVCVITRTLTCRPGPAASHRTDVQRIREGDY